MAKAYISYLQFAWGCMPAAYYGQGLVKLGLPGSSQKEFNNWLATKLPGVSLIKETRPFHELQTQLAEYFSGQRQVFSIPLNVYGSDFQKIVWQALQTIPYGQTCTYGDIAIQIGNCHAVRAVGGANNKNPIPLLIPCHRVIGKSGQLVGYGGGLELKRRLLDLEKQG